MISYKQLARDHIGYATPCWIGSIQTIENNNSINSWKWQDGSSFNISSKYYYFNNVEQRCGYWYPYQFTNKSRTDYINDWYCNDESATVWGWVTSYCWVCDKPDVWQYEISLKLGSSTSSTSNGDIYFRIKGSIENVTENETWTEWFIYDDGFTISGDILYNWNQTLKYVGDPTEIIVLTKSIDDLSVTQIGVDDRMMQDFGELNIVYSGGKLR